MPGPSRCCLLLLAALVSGCTGTGADPVASVSRTASLAPTPTAAATPTPTSAPSGTPAPTATADPATLDLVAISCEGGVVLNWSASTHPAFHHYTALRSPEREIEPDWPPIAPAVDWGHTYATDPFITSAVDASVIPSDTRWNYRVMAYDADGRVVSASPVRTAQLHELADLGSLRVDTVENGSTRLRWRAFAGLASCFSAYRVLYGVDAAPSTVLTVISAQDAESFETDALHPGTTYRLRVEAVRSTTLGTFIAGETKVSTYTVPET